MITDLRSDTFTKPGPEMMAFMMAAEVGDDVFGEDPTVNKLEAMAAAMFGMEAALFCPSGTMTNQIAIKCHTQPGNEVICEKNSHVYIYEGGGIAFNSNCQVKPIDGDRGRITAAQIEPLINPDDVHRPVTALVSLENTSNRGGGSCYDFSEFAAIKNLCREKGIRLHLDGARLFNAIVAGNENPVSYGEIFDSISICLSKGLGAPVGSLLLGNSQYIKQARRIRKLFGGGMRQAGILAAAGIYALQHQVKRLETDHIHAKKIAAALAEKDFIGEIYPVETNIVIFEVKGRYTAQSMAAFLKTNNILCIPISSTQIRMVTHLDVEEAMVERLLEVIKQM